MFTVHKPSSEKELAEYYAFRWRWLREPWGYPKGSEKDEYEGVSEHRMVKTQSGEIVACGRVQLNTTEEAQIRHIAVEKAYRRQGVGQIILSALEQVARDIGAERAVTNSRESSIHFFESAGFEIIDEAPTELGKLRRKQMRKHLFDDSRLSLHPKWCRELQHTWHEQIPISEHMGIKLFQYTEQTIETRASLNKNINLHGSMFAGSIYSLATLTGWGMIYLQLKQRGLEGEIVLGDGNIHYHKPITMKPRAICSIDSLVSRFEFLEAGKKCPIDLSVNILDAEKSVAKFHGKYWVLPLR
ncbi:YiiD C-terminal domain-containing protein [Ningiella sp. W23]|uniref:bifunctional GNAT family N-acetyltransferase/hotdog fold thioesterase n=1 Tax=Ningiella sp. W23 TaxID=3023715 RepID=UPI0037568604